MIPQAVLFDCDGVIMDSEPIALALLSADLAEYGLPADPAHMGDLILGGTVAQLFLRARALGAALPEDWVAGIYARLYARLGAGVPLVPGILAVLDRLDAAGVPYAIGSNGTDEKMQIMLGQYPGLRERFRGHIYSGQSLGIPKPAPDLYLHAARALGVAPQHSVVIEDSPTGARAAARAGMRCLGFAAHEGGARLAAEGAEVFHAMADLPARLGLG